MEKSIYQFKDYKGYLKAITGQKQRSGLKQAIARAAQCQSTYVSQVLNGNANFSLEQANKICSYLGHSKDERHFFLLLLQKEKAGDTETRTYFNDQIQNILKNRLVLIERLGKSHVLDDVQQSIYYSSWIYGAVHFALAISALNSKKGIARHFQISVKKVNEVLDFLLKNQLIVERSDGWYDFGQTHIRLGNQSPNIIKHHTNWRLRAIESLERESTEELHYSGVYSVSKQDIVKIKDRLLEEIKHCQKALSASGAEELYCIGVDFFNLKVQSSD